MSDSQSAGLSPAVLALIDLAIEEDFGRGDVTGELIFDDAAMVNGGIIGKQALVVAGLAVADAVFARVDARIRFQAVLRDGDAVQAGQVVALVAGPTRGLLAAERTALNFMQRLSGIATLTRQFVDAVAGTKAIICDTRKTAPGFRALDKLAVRLGGGRNHRACLASGVLIKDNHIAACGSVAEAVSRGRRLAPHGLRIEVELTALSQIEEALDAGAEIILLDNMTPALVKKAVAQIAGRALVEISGGITLATVSQYAIAGVDRISVGALTHSAHAADLSLEL